MGTFPAGTSALSRRSQDIKNKLTPIACRHALSEATAVAPSFDTPSGAFLPWEPHLVSCGQLYGFDHHSRHSGPPHHYAKAVALGDRFDESLWTGGYQDNHREAEESREEENSSPRRTGLSWKTKAGGRKTTPHQPRTHPLSRDGGPAPADSPKHLL